MSTDDDDLLALARKANRVFVIPGDIDRLLEPISACIPALAPPYREIAEAFSTNIRSVIVTAGVPYMFALDASRRRRYQLFECAAELETVLNSSAESADSSLDQSHVARADAERRIQALADSQTGRASLNR